MRAFRSGADRRSKNSKLRKVECQRKLRCEMLECRLVLAQTTGLFLDQAGASNDFTLFSPNTTTKTYLLDSNGTAVHQWQSAYTAGLMGYLLPDGSLLRDSAPHGQGGNGSINAAGSGGLLERFDWDGNKTWEFAYDSPTHLAHHDFEVMPNGNILLIAWELKSATEVTAAGRNPSLPGPGYLYPDSIVEVHPDYVDGGGSVVWEWHIWDHLVQQYDPSKANYYGPTGVSDHPELINLNYTSSADEGGGAPEDWTHCNGIDYNPDLDQIVLSSREFSEFWIIDHSTTTAQAAGHSGGNSGKGGDLLYRWGNPQTYGRGTAADRTFYYQHDARLIDDGLPGAGDITVFNNGFGRPGTDFSEADEITTPVDANGNYPTLAPGQTYGPASPSWTYAAPVADFSPIISSVQRLPDGNTRVTFGVNGNINEVTPDGQVVWKYVNPYTSGGTLGPNDPIPSLGLSGAGLNALKTNFVFQSAWYPRSYVTQLLSTVAARHLYYHNSFYDDPANDPSFSDDTAIATDKLALLPGEGIATFSNVSNYEKGINGLMVDLAGGGLHASINASDFSFKTSGPGTSGVSNDPSTWTTLNVVPNVFVRPGAGAGGSDRVEIFWPDGTILGTWLEVIVKSSTATGLAADDHFYFGSAPGETGDDPDAVYHFTDASDEFNIRQNSNLAGSDLFYSYGLVAAIQNPYDINRDEQIDVLDQTAARRNARFPLGELDMIEIPLAGPFAPQPAPQETRDATLAAIASALTHLTAASTASAEVFYQPVQPAALDLNRFGAAGGGAAQRISINIEASEDSTWSGTSAPDDPWPTDDDVLDARLGWEG